MRQFWIYVMASAHRTLYVGVTNDLERRLFEHREGLTRGFVHQYNCHRLVYFEAAEDPVAAITREKEIKGWLRSRKIQLIEARNPRWKDLSQEWTETVRDPSSLRFPG